MIITAPAKINLSLRILGKRSDGYHEIETLMAPLTLADELEITCVHTGTPNPVTLLCNDPSLPCGPENLCVKAALAFQEASGIKTPIAITLLKRIPHGAGLGGGSSDAAAVLRGMNQLFGEPLFIEELHQIAASLGSDIPFFLELKPSWCRGRGELLQEADPLPPWRLLLIKPPFSIATAWTYSRLQGTGDRGQAENRLEAESSISHLPSSVAAAVPPTSSLLPPTTSHVIIDGITIVNDLELPVFEKYLLLPVLKEWLQERKEIRHAWMTGSGSTMVALLREEVTPEAITMLKKEIASDFGATFWIKETGFRENHKYSANRPNI